MSHLLYPLGPMYSSNSSDVASITDGRCNDLGYESPFITCGIQSFDFVIKGSEVISKPADSYLLILHWANEIADLVRSSTSASEYSTEIPRDLLWFISSCGKSQTA